MAEAALIRQCCRLIEAKLRWGPSEQWSRTDFEALQERILLETGVNLSTSTLRRVWGKVRYQSAPQLATLNALARFAHFENWREFVSGQLDLSGPAFPRGQSAVKPTPARRRSKYVAAQTPIVTQYDLVDWGRDGRRRVLTAGFFAQQISQPPGPLTPIRLQ